MNITFVRSVLMEQALAHLRDKQTSSDVFRHYLGKLGIYLSYEAAKRMDTQQITINTPVAETKVEKISHEVVVLSILRAAMPLANAVLDEFDNSSLGMITASREEMIGENGTSFHIKSGYSKIPALENKVVFIVDTILATGSTIKYLLDLISDKKPKKAIILVGISSEFGLRVIEECYPEVDIFCGAIDKELNSVGYLVPGLGDAGDRVCNTMD